jgi:rare lipoprotein A
MIRLLIVCSLFFGQGAMAAPTVRTVRSHGPTTVKRVKNLQKIQYGTASYYSNKFEGKKTANGEVFSQKNMTCAHNGLPFGTWLKVTNRKNGKWVYVRVTDRLHAKNKRVVDLTTTAAKKLGYYKKGLTNVKVEVMGKKMPE